MAEEKPARRSPNGSKKQPPATPTGALDSWASWHRPRVLISLVTVFLMAVGIGVTAFVAKGTGGHGGDMFNTTIQQSQNMTAAQAGNSADQDRQRGVPQAVVQSSRPRRYAAHAPADTAAPPRRSTPGVAQQPGVSIHVDRSAGAITAQNITANSIEVRPQ